MGVWTCRERENEVKDSGSELGKSKVCKSQKSVKLPQGTSGEVKGTKKILSVPTSSMNWTYQVINVPEIWRNDTGRDMEKSWREEMEAYIVVFPLYMQETLKDKDK